MNTKLKAIFFAGFTAGILDILAAVITYAYILNVMTAQRVLQSVAAGIYGKETYTGGWKTAVTGLVFHFIIALIFAAIFVLMYKTFKRITSNKIISGIAYGCLIWLIMNYIVMPLSAIGHVPQFSWKYTSISLGIIIVFAGLPVSLITEKIFEDNSRKTI